MGLSNAVALPQAREVKKTLIECQPTEPSRQKPDLKYDGLRGYAAHAGLDVVQDYCDVAVSGRRETRPQLNALMAAARKREIDCVLLLKFDRFGRSTRHLLTALEEFDHLGVRFISVQDQVDTDSPMGRAMFTIIGAMAELEFTHKRARHRRHEGGGGTRQTSWAGRRSRGTSSPRSRRSRASTGLGHIRTALSSHPALNGGHDFRRPEPSLEQGLRCRRAEREDPPRPRRLRDGLWRGRRRRFGLGQVGRRRRPSCGGARLALGLLRLALGLLRFAGGNLFETFGRHRARLVVNGQFALRPVEVNPHRVSQNRQQ
jgi:DNA invertase Pin-like site-specific DNA recombinase